jgi:hypothetical protein
MRKEEEEEEEECRLKSFVRLLISNCHPSLAPPLVSQTLSVSFFFFLNKGKEI